MNDKRRTQIIKSFLRYSFGPVLDQYEDLTDEEKEICTEEEFNQLLEWIKSDS